MDVGKNRRQRHHQADLFAEANLEHCWTQNHHQGYKEETDFHLFVEQNLKVVLKLMANLEAVVLLKVMMLGHYLLLWPAPSHDLSGVIPLKTFFPFELWHMHLKTAFDLLLERYSLTSKPASGFSFWYIYYFCFV